MSSKDHKYSNKAINNMHNELVISIGKELIHQGHEVSYPDKDDNENKQPDILCGDNLVIEVKYHNPTKDIHKEDRRLHEAFLKGIMIDDTESINTKPLQRDIKQAHSQLNNRTETDKLILIACDLNQRMSPWLVKEMLKGTLRLKIQKENGETIYEEKINVPMKKEYSKSLTAVLYLYGSSLKNRKLWYLNDARSPIIDSLCKESEMLWPKK